VEAAERTARTRHRQLDPAQRGGTHVVVRILRISRYSGGAHGVLTRIVSLTRARIADPARSGDSRAVSFD
jgi:hypothetical protein